MGLLNWLRNAVGINDAGRESANLNENKLLEWLGIDRSNQRDNLLYLSEGFIRDDGKTSVKAICGR